MKEKFTYFKFVLAILFCFVSGVAYSQSNVSIQLRQSPPYLFHVENMWKVALTNNSQTPNAFDLNNEN